MEEYSTGNATVDALTTINFTGNVIPQMWYKTVLKENGKPHLLAITLLADIVYWYRPIEIRDEQSGKFIGYKKKFKDDDLLQRSYSQFADLYGESKRSITEAIIRLEDIGVIQRVFRTVLIGGIPYNNVLFLELHPDKLYELTYPNQEKQSASELLVELDTPITKKCERGHKSENDDTPLSQKNVTGVTKKCERGHVKKGEGSQNFVTRNTKITTKITTENISSSSKLDDDEYKVKVNYEECVEKFGEELARAVFDEIKKKNCWDIISSTQIFYEICNNIWLYSSQIANRKKYICTCIDNLLESQKLIQNRESGKAIFKQDYGDMKKLEDFLLSRER